MNESVGRTDDDFDVNIGIRICVYRRCWQGEVVIATIIMCIIRPSTLLAIRIAAKHDDGTVVVIIVCSARMLLFGPKPIFRCAICYAQFSLSTFGHFRGRVKLIYIFVSISHFNFVTWKFFSLSLCVCAFVCPLVFRI